LAIRALLTALLGTLADPAAAAPRFRDRSAESGLAFANRSGAAEKNIILESTGSGVALLDFDGDLDLDIYLLRGAATLEGAAAGGNVLYRNDGALRFTDVTAAAAVAGSGWSCGAAAADFDNDGDTDLYVTRFGANLLYRNRGDGTFELAPGAGGAADPGLSLSAAAGDYDRDGWLDLYVCNYLTWEPNQVRRIGDRYCFYRAVEVYCGPDGLPGAVSRLYRNRGDGSFEDRTAAAGVARPELKAMSAQWTDLDGDHWPDLYVASDSTSNLLLRNRGDGRFDDLSLASGAAVSGAGAEQSGMGSSSGDADGDGDFDLMVTNFQNDSNTLYRNLGGLLFADASAAAGLALASYDRLSWSTAFVDLDSDGDLDLYVVSGHVYPQAAQLGEPYAQRPQIFLNRGDGSFSDASAVAGAPFTEPHPSRGAAWGDLDDDGAIELVVNAVDGPARLWSAAPSGNHYLAVRLRGRRSNRDGFGARLRLLVGDRWQAREARASDGYLSSNDPRVRFGLGARRGADHLIVLWPSGTRQTFDRLPADRVLLIDEEHGLVDSSRP
jgi:hypothetical protein